MLELLRETVRTMESGTPAVLVTVIGTGGPSPGKEGAKMLVRADGSTAGTVGGGALEARAIQAAFQAMSCRHSRRLTLGQEEGGLASLGMACGGHIDLLLEYMSSGPEVHVFGAGHVGLAVGELAKFAGFRVRLIDDRQEFASRTLAPWADEVRVQSFPEAAAATPGGVDSYVVIVTRGHEWDTEVLYHILRAEEPPFYVGMIGSRQKVESCCTSLRSRGVSENSIALLHAPIGLHIGGNAPKEIAVSIVAEMIAARYGLDSKCSNGGATGGDSTTIGNH